MTDAERDTIAKLAETAHNARRAYEFSRCWNTSGLTAEAARKQTVAAELLYAEMIEANGALAAAKMALVSPDRMQPAIQMTRANQ